jgi:N-dimethylarginine dimethylaminohydrolase
MTERRIIRGAQSMTAPLCTVVVKRPEEAFRSDAVLASQWQDLGYHRAPDFPGACREHARLVAILEATGAEVLSLPANADTGPDSLYTHDPVLATDGGALILRTGKEARRGEGPAAERAFADWGIPVLGRVGGDGTAEAGDMLWLDPETLVVGRSFRTNAEGLRQVGALLGPRGITLVPVHLPYDRGPGDVLHLMSLISLLDRDLAVVFRPLLPVPLVEILAARGIALIDVPPEEYPTLGTNVLALGPRDVLVVEGNPRTRAALEAAGCRVTGFGGEEICHPGAGGPTCLTRPISRSS